jgi:hypothetical protein
MTATVDGITYEIEFRHGKVDTQGTARPCPKKPATLSDRLVDAVFGVTEEREATTCNIRVVGEAKHREEWKIVARGNVIRYWKDPPNREVARKAALLKAVYEKWPVVDPGDVNNRIDSHAPAKQQAENNKAHRAAILGAYFNRKKGVPKTSAAKPGVNQ